MDNKRFLVVVRAGAASLHPEWLAGRSTRNWDLFVCGDGADARPAPAADGCPDAGGRPGSPTGPIPCLENP